MKSSAIALFVCLFGQLQGDGEYKARFLQQYHKIHDPTNGYYSKQGVPYHSAETLMVDITDHGHESTSEAYSYWIWMEAMYGKLTGNFSSFNAAWENMEQNIIPVHASQIGNNNYNPSKPATYADELDWPSDYPIPLQFDVPVGQDPIFQELVDTYGSYDIYAMHWLLDADNVYGFGNLPGSCELGPEADGPSYINTFERGPEESTWRTIPQPTCDTFKYGGQHGFSEIFAKQSSFTKSWKYSNAPDADARAIQAAFWAHTWANEEGKSFEISSTIEKAAKLGDYLRYAMFDKYFKRIGNCVGPHNCPGGQGRESAHFLLSWYFGWGGALSGEWTWRIGDGTAFFGYQNPMAAYALSNVTAMKPKSATGASDWQASLDRQLEFYGWLQSEEGAIAGGVTNSWNGRYDTPPENLTENTFHGMFYDWQPVCHDPPTNRWYGMQPWSLDRLAQYYYVTGDEKAKTVLDKWVNWIISEIEFKNGNFQLPEWLDWSGVPPNVHVIVAKRSSDTATASATARTLSYYAAKTGDQNVKNVAKQLLDCIWNHQTTKGVSVEEVLDSYSRFNETVYVPENFKGYYPNGDVIEHGATFISLRSFYKRDPEWYKIEAYLNGGEIPRFTYHRFWAQSDVALAQGTYGILFNE
uniref:Glycoside hydrolase family protein 48 n=1 Tax=Gastrophysa viridula TaxID=154015 RepID=E7CIX5_GASVI|nr:glycoside hydrolase family protein 48 [Gastrophysa viridula]